MQSLVGCVSDTGDVSAAFCITLFAEDSRKLRDAVSLRSQFCAEKGSNQLAVAGVSDLKRPRGERFPLQGTIQADKLIDRQMTCRDQLSATMAQSNLQKNVTALIRAIISCRSNTFVRCHQSAQHVVKIMPAFRSIRISKNDNSQQTVVLTEMDDDDLMQGDVTIDVAATTVNYKDGLAVTGKSPVIRHWPMVPGIDLAGTVTESDRDDFVSGDQVVLNGFGIGESHFGGFSQKARVNGDWLIKRPNNISARQAMSIGTAGYTAMLCVIALENRGVTPDRGPVVVTGANGGVGTIAISLLSSLGYEVIASTGRLNETDFLKDLGASEVVDRAELSSAGRALGKERWAGGVDGVGSHTLANVLSHTRYGGAVAACGLAQGADLPATVMPFILRGVSLIGIDSVYAPISVRMEAWSRLARDLDLCKLDTLTSEIAFEDLIQASCDIIEGTIRGRLVAMM